MRRWHATAPGQLHGGCGRGEAQRSAKRHGTKQYGSSHARSCMRHGHTDTLTSISSHRGVGPCHVLAAAPHIHPARPFHGCCCAALLLLLLLLLLYCICRP